MGVVATRALDVDDMFVRIPANLTLSERQANASALLAPVIARGYNASAASDSHFNWDGVTSLAVMLMWEKWHNPNSFYAPYLELLPLMFPGMVVVFAPRVAGR